MDSQNKHIFQPYREECKVVALLFAALTGLLAIFGDGSFASWVLRLAAVGLCIHNVLLCLLRVEVSDQWIRFYRLNGGRADVYSWEEFSQAFLLDVAWTNRGRYNRGRYCAWYLLLTRFYISNVTMQELGRQLADSHPCGKWKEHVALRLSEEQIALIRGCIGQNMEIEQASIDRDEATRL